MLSSKLRAERLTMSRNNRFGVFAGTGIRRMHVDNATQNAMQCKCIALRRIAVRKLPLLPPYGRRSKRLRTVVADFYFYSSDLVSYTGLTQNWVWAGFLYGWSLLPSRGVGFCRQFPWEGLSCFWLTRFLEVTWADLLALAVDTPTACCWERVRACRRYRRLR